MTRSSRNALVALMTVALACCTSWGRPAPVTRALIDKNPSRLRVMLTDGRQLVVRHARVERDSLFGDTLVLNLDRVVTFPVAIPVRMVRSVSGRRFSAGNTMVLVLAVPAVVVVLCAASPDCMRFRSVH